jgi:ATP-dependent DNA helicase RecG
MKTMLTNNSYFYAMIEQVRKILTEGESITSEFKTSKTELSKNVFDSICAFLNRNGGNLLLGVTNNGTIEGIDKEKIHRVYDTLVTNLNNPQKLSPTFYLTPAIVEIDGKLIIHLQIPESSQVHSTAGRIFDRNGDGDFNISGNHALVEQLYQRKSNSFSETTIYKYLAFTDFRPELIARVRKTALIQRPGHPWENMTDEELLKSAKLYRKDFKTGEEGYTLAAALLFGKDEVIHNILPAYKTDAIVRKVNTDRYDDRLEVRTNLIESYDLLMEFARKHLPDPFHLEKDQRISLRDTIFREIIANTLIHREYLNSFPAKFIIENATVTIENWNKPYGHGLINPVNFYTHPKNPNILEVFKQIGRAEELGSGVRNVFRYAKVYGGAEPVFQEGDVFKTIIALPVKAEKVKEEQEVKTGEGISEGISEGLNGAVNIYSRIIDAVNDAVKAFSVKVNETNDTIKGADVTINDTINGTDDIINDTIKKRYIDIVETLLKSPGLRSNALSGKMNVTEVTIRRDMQTLDKLDLVEYRGSKKTGGYYLTQKLLQKIKL